MALEDGTYTLDLTGPLALNGIRLGALELEDLRFADAAISSQGSLDEFSREGVRLAGAWRGTLERDARGMANVLLGQDGGRVRATVAPGSRLEVDLPDVRYAERFRDRSEPAALSARGRLSGEARLEGVRGGRSGWTVDAPAGTARFALELDADLASGVRSARGTIDAKLDAPARLSASSDGAGLPPERPLVRTQPPAPRRHRVARGDTLSRIARRYGVPLADLRAANGMGPSDSLIRVGEELTIPGEASVRPRPRPRPRPAETGRRRADFELAPGSRLSIDLEDASLGRDGLRARGTARGDLVVSSAQLATRDLEATILGRAQAALAEARFDLGPAADGAARLRVKPFRVPVRIDLSPGSRVLSRGGAVDVRLDRPGSSARFAAVVEPGPDGGLRVTSLEDCDLVLESSAAARFAGRVAEAPGAKTVRYQGRMVLVPGGIDFYGDVTVRIRGDEETPALRIRW
ncbi:MAG: LysM peptidoglycan-binding domain-containing protein [Planctomycetota bacterium]|nr:MAG: LysM peptidoglycan-binding domain-containing protein [Planctomycetota bacterium]